MFIKNLYKTGAIACSKQHLVQATRGFVDILPGENLHVDMYRIEVIVTAREFMAARDRCLCSLLALTVRIDKLCLTSLYLFTVE